MTHQSTDGRAQITSFSPEPPLPVVITEEEEEKEYTSLEEALLGE